VRGQRYNPGGEGSEAIMALPQRRTAQPDQDWRAQYEIENPDEVEAYVAELPSVTAILAEAPNEIQAVFGNQSPPRLRLTWDPEDGDCWLFVRIPVEDEGPAALPLIEALEQRWWLDRMTATDATLGFGVEKL
jgi:hypothetical protein